MIADEECKALVAEHSRRQQQSRHTSLDSSVCLMAVDSAVPQDRGPFTYPYERDDVDSSTKEADVLGTLDLYAVQALQGEVLIGMSSDKWRGQHFAQGVLFLHWQCLLPTCCLDGASGGWDLKLLVQLYTMQYPNQLVVMSDVTMHHHMV